MTEQLRRTLGLIAKQMGDLNLSQRLALVLGAALVATSLLWLAQWSASPEWTPLLQQDLSGEELATLQSGLDQIGEPYDVRGARIYVRESANVHALLAQLQQEEKLPTDTSIGFAALVKESNPWLSQAEHERRWRVALKTELERALREFEGVKDANVFLNLDNKRRLVAREELPASASVTLVRRGGEPVPLAQAKAAARLVAGVDSRLTPERVQVIDGAGRVALDWSAEVEGSMSKLHREQIKRERDIANKIRAQLPDMHAHVSVRVELNTTTRQQTIDEPSTAVERSNERTTLETTRGLPGGQPGVGPNTGVDLTSGTMLESTKQNTTRTESEVGHRVEHSSTPSGDIEAIFAAISLSDRYLASIYQRTNPDADVPTADQLETVFTKQRDRIRNQVRMLVKADSSDDAAEQIDVSWHFEMEDPDRIALASSSDQVVGWVSGYGAQAAMGLLALFSLGLMLRMARRSKEGESFGMEIGLPNEAIEAALKAAEDLEGAAERAAARNRKFGSVGPDTDNAPSAQASEGMLVAQEVDESTVQVNKMVEQVSEFVEKDAETVANLFERWVDAND